MNKLTLFAALAAACLAAPAALATPKAEATVTATAEKRMPHISIVALGEPHKGRDPVYLIPGMSSPRAVWDGVAPQIARDRQVLLVQVNGFAGDEPGENLAPGVTDGIIEDILADASARGAKQPALIGHSYGGLIAMMMAARHPERIGSLMVVDALPFFSRILDPAATPDSIRPRAEQMRTMLAGNYERAKAAAATPVTRDPGGNLSILPAGRIQVSNWSMKADLRVVAQAMFEDMVTDIGPELGKVTARPFTVLYAAGADGAAQVWEPAYAGTAAKLVAVPDSYHFIMLDQPERFAAEVKAFLTN